MDGMVMMRKNDMETIEITGYTAEGNGVGRAGGMAVFVPGAAAGDTLRVRIVKVLKNYAFGKIEEILAGGMLILISVLVFLSAVARTIGMPVNWAQDVSLLAFAWLTFIGSDIIAKSGSLIRIDMLADKLPAAVQKILTLIFDVMMVLFLLILIVYGFILVSQSWNRTFNTLKMSYAWCTLAVPIGSLLMIFTIIGKLIGDLRRPVGEWRNK